MIEQDKPHEDQTNSEPTKSEEQLNFEKGLRHILSLTPEQVEEVKKKTPFKSDKKKK